LAPRFPLRARLGSDPKEGNGCAELIGALKENLLWVGIFRRSKRSGSAAGVHETYDRNWLIERHGFMTPTAFPQMQLQPIAEAA
jgi:hypothetical protein